MKRPLILILAVILLLTLSVGLAYSQVGGGYDLSWSTIDGGGYTFSTGGSYSLGGTIGQPDAGTMSGDSYTLTGGFWGAAEVVATSTSTPTPLPTQTPGGPTATPVPSNTPTRTPTLARTNTPLPTQTPGGPTATPVPTNTALPSIPTPTVCPIQFSDVPQGSTFYPFIRCLACRGIINGYGDGTFRPNNNVTRGQLSKIVSNSAGFNEPVTGQMFQDVPPGSTFFDYIGRLASRGYINGYPCGGSGEPCVPPGNLPYFRTNNNATRGQISKIVSNAAQYTDPPSGQQFQDVAVASTYYTYTYRLVSRFVMSGYPCGAASEPCVHPQDLPYFRPNANATRGQTSKIVANTFFPGCSTPSKR